MHPFPQTTLQVFVFRHDNRLTMTPAPGGKRESSGGNHHHHHNRLNPYDAVAMVVEDDGVARNRNRRTAPAAEVASYRRPTPAAKLDDQRGHLSDSPPNGPQNDSVTLPKHITVDKKSSASPRRSRNRSSSSRSNNNTKVTTKTAAHFLISLSEACERHSTFHPELSAGGIHNASKKRRILRPPPTASLSSSISPTVGGANLYGHRHQNQQRIPEDCAAGISTCSIVVAKLKEKMPPPLPETKRQADPGRRKQQQQNKQLLDDVVHFCQFVQSTLFGDYCPHMAELFGWGRNVHVGTYVYLSCLSLCFESLIIVPFGLLM